MTSIGSVTSQLTPTDVAAPLWTPPHGAAASPISDVDQNSSALPLLVSKSWSRVRLILFTLLPITALPHRTAMATWAYPPLPPDRLNREADSALVR